MDQTRYSIESMQMDDYEEILALWRNTPGMGLSGSDEPGPIAGFLERNPGLSLVAKSDAGVIVGTLLAGHDGRRGYLHHLAVHGSHRRQGIAQALTKASLKALAKLGILKCHTFVFRDNEQGLAYWRGTGWQERGDLLVVSRNTDIA